MQVCSILSLNYVFVLRKLDEWRDAEKRVCDWRRTLDMCIVFNRSRFGSSARRELPPHCLHLERWRPCGHLTAGLRLAGVFLCFFPAVFVTGAFRAFRAFR